MQRKPRLCGGVPAAALRRVAVAVLAAWICAACSGAVPPDADDGAEGGSGGKGSEGETPIAGPIPETKAACAKDAPAAGQSHWRRLTALQYENTVKDLLGQDVDTTLFLSDTTTGRFTTNTLLATPDAQVQRYQDSAAKVAAAAVQNLSTMGRAVQAARWRTKKVTGRGWTTRSS